MLPLEIEVKFYVPNTRQMQIRIHDLQAIPQSSGFEKNIRFENKDKTLLKEKALLRLRQADRVTLTYKSPAPIGQDQFKIHTELEVVVDDFETTQNILKSIGFYPAQIYEKIRKAFVLEDTILCLDRMPYGAFIEIEGKKEDIRQTAGCLGLDWKDRILLNYLEIFELLKQKLNLKFSDVTFGNFKNIEVDFSRYLHLFIAG